MAEKKKYIVTIIVGVVVIILINLLIIFWLGRKQYTVASFLGNWELKISLECASCVKLYDTIQIRGDSGCLIEDKQLKIPKRLLVQDYTIPTDEYYCFNLDTSQLKEETCKDTKELSSYNLIYNKSS